ncbi:hypothetical protein GV829_02790 [Sphingomonas lacunae]|uniref:Uncharacterized protein n=1 Tax=Sphingomonas lacunae TaxID=2698828 RepID=A0A6M4AR28_9SPHN|nr:hypothetical protein [Sphingomonas lacunae]QJQ31508.1 hypothetical protein GV829_02790 [Sphingomonas lacunae]
MWRWSTVNYQCHPNYQCRFSGTFLISPGQQTDRYDVSLNITQVDSPGTIVERQGEAEQDCVGIRTGSRLSMQCTVDRARYPTWSPDDFTFEVSPDGRSLTGFMLGDPPADITGTKL